MRCRYETYLGGRLLKITDLISAGSLGQAADEPPRAVDYIDGRYRWEVDGREVGEDVALAMLDAGDKHTGPPYTGLPVSDRALVWLLLRRFGTVTLTGDDVAEVPSRPDVTVSHADDGPPGWTLAAS